MPQIELLSPSVVNKIAAGEVIERPASVVKELVENSLDAGAGRIDVTVEGGGGELIRVTDDGCGIAPEQLPLAVASHATSKIRTAEDLFRVGSLGFRGEALASIAEVSRLLLRSREANSQAGAELEIVGGTPADAENPVAPCGCPVGTTIEVHNLFFNTPVRRKFLKTAQTEMGHITEALTRLALAHPHVHFTLRHNTRTLHDLPPTENWLQRIDRFFGGDVSEKLIWVEGSSDEQVRLFGYVGHPSCNRGNPKLQYLFLNGRFVKDRALSHALAEAYRGLLLTGRYAVCFLCIEVPADSVDVNVHPTKLEVRFQNGGRVYSQLLGTLRTKFLSTDLNARWQPPPEGESSGNSSGSGDPHDPAAAHDPRHAQQVRNEFVAWAKGELSGAEAEAGQAATASNFSETPQRGQQSRFDLPGGTRLPLSLNRLDRSWPDFTESRGPNATTSPKDAHSDEDSADKAEGWDAPLEAGPAMQIHDRYLVAESAEGMMVIDQHALHERVLYEQFREKVLAGALESQNLLVPEPVDLSAEEHAAVMEHSELLAQLGVKVEPFGGETVLVSSYPAMLSRLNVAETFRSLVEQLTEGSREPQRRDLLDELLHMMSCKAAIKAGDRLLPEEIDALLQQRHLARDTHHCPHGRPTALVLTREELDRQFLRT